MHIDPPPSSSLGGLPTPPEECTQRWARLPGLSFSHPEGFRLYFPPLILTVFFPHYYFYLHFYELKKGSH